MSDEDLGELGDGRARTAGERFEHEDRLRPEPDDRLRSEPDPRNRPDVPRPGSRYAWVVGILMLMLVGVVLLTNGVPNKGKGLRGPPPGRVVPDFAAPLATGRIDGGDANVRGAGNASESAGPVPACEVRSEEVVNVCELRRKPLVLTFLVTEGADCEPQVDRVERMRGAFPDVRFAAVVSGNDREDVEQIVRRRGWRLPVAVDEDGAVVNLYRVGVCPTTVFVRPGGRVRKTRLGNLTEEALRSEVRKLLAERPA